MSNIAIIIDNLSGVNSSFSLKKNGKTILEYTIERIRKIDKVDRVFLGIEKSTDPRMREILNIIEPLGILPLRIGEEDCLSSLSRLNLLKSVKNFLLFNPVSPFIDPELSSDLLHSHTLNGALASQGENFPSGVLPLIINKKLFSLINAMEWKSPNFTDSPKLGQRCNYLKDSGELGGLNLFVEGPYSLALFHEFMNRAGGKSWGYGLVKNSIKNVLADLMENFKDVHGKKYFNRMLNRIERNKKSRICKSYPLYMHVGLNSKCNLKCSTCHHQFSVLTRKEYHDFLESTERLSYNRMFQYEPGADLYKRKKNLDMSWELYKKIAASVFKYLKEIRFGVNGETLLYKRLGPALAYAKENGVDSSIISNGMLLNEKIIPVLLDEGLKVFTLSIDSTRDILLKKIRKGANLDSIVRRIKLLIDEKEKRNLGFPSVGFAFTAARENIEELPDLVGLAASLGAKFVCVQFRYISNFMDPKESLYFHRQLCLEYFNRARKKANELKVELSLPSFGGKVADCDMAWTTINVSHDGNAVPCCTMNISRSYGILNGENFMEVWNGDRFTQFRESFRNGRELEYQCVHCILGDRLDFDDPLRFFGERHAAFEEKLMH